LPLADTLPEEVMIRTTTPAFPHCNRDKRSKRGRMTTLRPVLFRRKRR